MISWSAKPSARQRKLQSSGLAQWKLQSSGLTLQAQKKTNKQFKQRVSWVPEELEGQNPQNKKNPEWRSVLPKMSTGSQSAGKSWSPGLLCHSFWCFSTRVIFLVKTQGFLGDSLFFLFDRFGAYLIYFDQGFPKVVYAEKEKYQ